jgi:hypothetical protein
VHGEAEEGLEERGRGSRSVVARSAEVVRVHGGRLAGSFLWDAYFSVWYASHEDLIWDRFVYSFILGF